MNRKELYDQTVSIMVNAFLNETLIHDNSCGCLAGNLLYRPKNKAAVTSLNKGTSGKWFTYLLYWRSAKNAGVPLTKAAPYQSLKRLDEGKKELLSYGYTIEEWDKLEEAFEVQWLENRTGDSDGYHGMMAVMDVLHEIHEVPDPVTVENKLKFSAKYEMADEL